mmetsp:Transcript_3189/g.7513  ORF Transcript_3189/g.7513 Transcript_3189/m.7513 type:complete len:92 (+) Transcript_3189:3744-4019(+)
MAMEWSSSQVFLSSSGKITTSAAVRFPTVVRRYANAYALVYLANTPDEAEDEVERREVSQHLNLLLLRQQQINRPYGLFGTARLVEYPKYE